MKQLKLTENNLPSVVIVFVFETFFCCSKSVYLIDRIYLFSKSQQIFAIFIFVVVVASFTTKANISQNKFIQIIGTFELINELLGFFFLFERFSEITKI